ncbi:MAG: hypothetical protein Q8L48_20570 [Archangium sp.]|nr:hypothetical protein [Archangium sp.]
MKLALSLLLLTGLIAHAEPPNERLDIALKAYRLAATGYREGNVPQELVVTWSLRAWELQKASGAPNAGADYVFRMKDLENVATARVKDGRATALEQLNAQYLRLEAELAAKKK